MVADNIIVENDLEIDVVMNLNYNPEVGSKTVNVALRGRGPICRLDVDGPPHRPAGRCHKHSLKTPACLLDNVKIDVCDMPELSGKPFTELLTLFCAMAKITFEGTFHAPDVAEEESS